MSSKKHCYKCGEDYYSFHICSAEEDDKPSLFDNSYLNKKHCYKCGEDYYVTHNCKNDDLFKEETCSKCGESYYITHTCKEDDYTNDYSLKNDKCTYCGAEPSYPGVHHKVTCPNYRRLHRYEDDPLRQMHDEIWHKQVEAAAALRIWERVP